jgi:uncharacterized protein DUF3108
MRGPRRFKFRVAYQAACVVAVLMCLLALAHAQDNRRTPLPFAGGEELIYQAEFTRGLLRGVDVAEFHFKSATEHVVRGTDDPVVLRLSGDVLSKGLFPRIAGFKFHQHVESTADIEPLTVLHTDKLEEQGKRSRVLEAVFDHKAHKVTWSERSPNPQSGAFDFTEPIQDVLTVVYYLRTQNLAVGNSFDVPVTDAGRVYRLSVHVIEEKEIDTVLGKVKAVRVDPALFGDTSLVHARGQLSIWLTEDDRHLPVRAQLKIDLGTFDIKLKRVTYPQPN